jgi:hypothetical protein
MTEILTAAEVCKLLKLDVKCPRRTLAYYRDRGWLRGVRIGREFRYRAEDVQRFIDRMSLLTK